MTPSQIAAQASTINSFKAAMLTAFSEYANMTATKLKTVVNKRELAQLTQKLMLSNAYITIMIDFFNETVEGDVNLFTNDEFYDIVKHMNRLFDTQYWITLL